MAKCGTCGHDTPKLRSMLRNGEFVDECPFCAPQTFDAVQDPSTKKIWIGPEYMPNAYEKRYDKDGLHYVAKPEFTAEQEEKLFESSEEKEAVAKKKANRRTEDMSPTELEYAMRKAAEYQKALIEANDKANKQAELDAWVERAGKA